jgi:hypothetical protein
MDTIKLTRVKQNIFFHLPSPSHLTVKLRLLKKICKQKAKVNSGYSATFTSTSTLTGTDSL